MGGVLFQCIQAVLGTPAQLEEPPWAEEFEIQGLDSVESEVTAAQRHLAEAETELVGAERARDELKRLRSILWTSRKESTRARCSSVLSTTRILEGRAP